MLLGRGEGAHRRPRLCGKPVQPRHACPSSAGLRVQGIRLSGRTRAGSDALHSAHRPAGDDPGCHQELDPGQLYFDLSRAGDTGNRLCEIHQYRRRPARTGSWNFQRHLNGASFGYRIATRQCSFARNRYVGCHADRNDRRLCRIRNTRPQSDALSRARDSLHRRDSPVPTSCRHETAAILAGCRTRNERSALAGGAGRYGPCRRCARPRGGGQDRHQRGLSRRMVHRLLARNRHRRVDRQ